MNVVANDVSTISAGIRRAVADQRLLAFIDDDASESALRTGLAEHLGIMEFRRGGIRGAIKVLEHESKLAWLIVDLSGVNNPLVELDALAHVCPPDVTVLAIGENRDIEFYRVLTKELGIADYLPKPLSRDNVSRLFAPLLVGNETSLPTERGGRIVLMTGARGGVGTSTIAVNLANQIARVQHSHVVLLDLHLRLGTMAMIAGVKPGSGLRLALQEPDRIDSLFLDRVAGRVGDRLKIIAGDEALGQRVDIMDQGVSRIVELLRQKFNYVIVDLPMPPPRSIRQLITIARHSVLVLHPNVLSLRSAQIIRKTLIDAESTHQMLTVVNRSTMPGALGARLIEQGLESQPDVMIPEFGKAMQEAENLGKPAIEQIPAFAQALGPLMHEITGQPTVEPAKSFLARWRGR
jgi:pilus assembly protein CpaE